MAVEALSQSSLAEIVLLRVAATGRDGRKRTSVRRDLRPLVEGRLDEGNWREAFSCAVDDLVREGLLTAEKGGMLVATATGLKGAARGLGLSSLDGVGWSQIRDEYLIARALSQPASKSGARKLNRMDGLRSAIIGESVGLQAETRANVNMLRNALAYEALEGAFGSKLIARLKRKPVIPGKLGRTIAAHLLPEPTDIDSDARLVAEIAAHKVGADAADLPAMRLALLRRLIWPDEQHSARPATAAAKVDESSPADHGGSAMPDDLHAFARAVLNVASPLAHGWSGNRKAFVSDVWQVLQKEKRTWRLDEAAFKARLVEAHKAGELSLTNADLRDAENLARIKASAISYQNTEWHLIRVEDE